MAKVELQVEPWQERGIQVMVLLSFTLQLVLLVLAEFRRRMDSGVLRAVIWSAYMLADSTAVYTLGHLSVTSRSDDHELMALWAPFLLLHLGGQDNITAYAIEDNRLWLRHLQALVVQVAAAAYVLYESTVIGTLALLRDAAILIFVVGVIKYGERVWALKCADNSASGNEYRYFEGTKPPLINPGINWHGDTEDLLRIAHHLLDVAKNLFQGQLPVVVVHTNPQDQAVPADKLYKVVEMQLSLMHDVLYSKAEVIHTWDRGLSSSEAAARLRAHGPNELLDNPGPSLPQLVAQQFEDTLVRILLTAGAVSFALALSSSAGALTLSAFVEPLVIFLILVVNAAVGVWQETNAEKAHEALRQIQSDHAVVLLDAEWAPALPTRGLVPGDVVMVRVGDKVPADMRVLRLVSSTLLVEQGSLTGGTNSVNRILLDVLVVSYEARMKIYSVSTRHYFAFGALVSEELSYKLKELPKVRWVLPDSYLDVRNKDYGGEPFIDGQAVPYDPKYHEEWVRNNARANERSRRNDRPRNFDRSRNFERRRENTQACQSGPAPPGQSQMPPHDVAPPPRRPPQGPPQPSGAPPNYQPHAPNPQAGYVPGGPNYQNPPPPSGYQGAPTPGYQAGNQGYQVSDREQRFHGDQDNRSTWCGQVNHHERALWIRRKLACMAKEYFKFLNKYLATFDGSTDEADAIGAAKEEAAAAIIEFVKSADLYQI
ncbi:hypothetical protein ZWY2020_059408 [Hordeum vulgare]|nr:hypothetical protein ZWY2020_059408 [Hordeum vulgare]